MKTKYERMNKEEKKKAYEIYKKEKPELASKFKKMIILSNIGIVYGSLLFLYDFFINKSKLNYVLDIIVFIISLIVLLIIKRIKKNVLNNFIIKNKKRF